MKIDVPHEISCQIVVEEVQLAINDLLNINAKDSLLSTDSDADTSLTQKLIAALEITKWYFSYDPENKLQEKLDAIQLV